jgi:CubicO group peptidase (beta-lactamase class C family)
MRDVLERHAPPGAVALLARGDDVQVEAFGETERDAIFRIASLTKPITAAAVMLLAQEKRLSLDDPVARFVPEVASPVVVRTPEGPIDDVVPANRPITIEDTLTFLAGWGLPSDFSLPVVQLVFSEVQTWGRPEPFAGADEWAAALARVPLLHQPGDAWLYNTCSDLQGVIVERATGQTLGDFLAERVFEPLGMADTAFHVPAEKRARLAPSYGGDLAPLDGDDPGTPPAFASGSSGLYSTAEDWLRFGRMLLAGDGPLSPECVRLIATDHLTRAQRDAAALFLEGEGWGYGGAVGGGRYGWVGGSGTSAHVYFETSTVAVLLTQVQMTGPTPTQLMRDFWAVV